LETIPGLHSKIEEKIDEAYKSKVDLNNAEDEFRDLINFCITTILNSVEAKIEPHYQGMLKTDWAKFQKVGDTSGYARANTAVLKQLANSLRPMMNTTYFSFLLNKLAT
jgi:hypothetical protein